MFIGEMKEEKEAEAPPGEKKVKKTYLTFLVSWFDGLLSWNELTLSTTLMPLFLLFFYLTIGDSRLFVIEESFVNLTRLMVADFFDQSCHSSIWLKSLEKMLFLWVYWVYKKFLPLYRIARLKKYFFHKP